VTEVRAEDAIALGVSLGGARPSAPPRPEYPRPQLRRERWETLNGVWRFAFDDADVGRSERWHETLAVNLAAGEGPLTRPILVPFCPQSQLSGIGDPAFHDVVWYARTFETLVLQDRERVILHFGAVDYRATVWVNGRLVGRHEGGHTPFSGDVTNELVNGSNAVVVRCEDPGDDPTIPRGKQDWKEQPSHIFYNRTTGIWQTVWLEVVDLTHVDDLRITPDVDARTVAIAVRLDGWTPGTQLRIVASVEGRVAGVETVEAPGPDVALTLDLAQQPLRLWSPELPALYQLTVDVVDADGRSRDTVSSYFGMRKIEVVGDELQLNGRTIFLRLVLDQGYWPDGLLTAPTDAALRRDIELAMEMGFNGARKHQKVEDPRWLYWADRLGFLVWEEMPNAHEYSPRALRRRTQEWVEVVSRDYNHPCVIAWVPINESNGLRPLAADKRTWAGAFAGDFAKAMYHLTKALDSTRPVLSNDGWEHTNSDLCTIHDYRDAAALSARFASLAAALEAPSPAPPVYAEGHAYAGQPVIVTEYGGVFESVHIDGFDYLVAADSQDLVRQLAALTDALLSSPVLSGLCYTQLADVEHEQNGLLTANRSPKIPPARVREIIGAPAARERLHDHERVPPRPAHA
jgi:beta-galactosidase/beta-glucuronidase